MHDNISEKIKKGRLNNRLNDRKNRLNIRKNRSNDRKNVLNDKKYIIKMINKN